MSIYSALSIDVPVIAYTALHQMKKGAGEKEYARTIHDMHAMVQAESDNIAQVWQSHIKDITASSVQTTRGTLSQFLTLPLDTDVKEIHRILEDQFGQMLNQALPVSRFGAIATTEGRIYWEKEQGAVLQNLLNRGAEYLRKMKFRTKDAESSVFESDFFLESGLNLDVIEHIVRDRMGIYATAHGQHIRQSDPFVFAAHNLAYLHGALEKGDSKYEAVIHFTKGKVQYEQFRKGLSELLDSVKAALNVTHCSLWQRKLGLGAGTEFNVRFRGSDRRIIKDALVLFTKGAEKNPPLHHIVKTGSLLVKELTR